jgi:hypothetical protein
VGEWVFRECRVLHCEVRQVEFGQGLHRGILSRAARAVLSTTHSLSAVAR